MDKTITMTMQSIEMSEAELMDVDGGVDWYEVGLGVAAAGGVLLSATPVGWAAWAAAGVAYAAGAATVIHGWYH